MKNLAAISSKSPAGQLTQPMLQSHPVLHARTTAALARCHVARVPAVCMGIGPRIHQPLLYAADPNDWVFIRAADEIAARGTLAMPRAPKQTLKRIRSGGVTFDGYVIAHEVAPEAVAAGAAADVALRRVGGVTVLDVPNAIELIGPPPPARSTLRLSKALGGATEGLAKVTAVAAGAAAAGFAVVSGGALIAALAALGSIDPIVLGVIQDRTEPDVAAFCAVARWEW